VLYNGLGRYQDAYAAARQACGHEDLGLFGWCLVELIEGAASSGERQPALDALHQLEERARGGSTKDYPRTDVPEQVAGQPGTG
jgi:hypothetical protein